MAIQKKIFPGSLMGLYDKARQLVFDPPPPSSPMQMLPMTPPILPIPRPLMSPAHEDEQVLLLAPISEELPCGPALRYDPVFTDIRLAREEDDPSLPMRQWERPLKLADWPLIESLCKTMLADRSKDLQIAAWLLEAWTRQHAFYGLYRGLSLIDGLLRQYWVPLHPVIDDEGDCDARLAPLEWLNESLSVTLRIHVPLLNLAGHKPPKLTFADWERMTAKELSGQNHAQEPPKAGDPADAPLTRDAVMAYALQHLSSDIDSKIGLIRNSRICLDSVLSFVDAELGNQSPNLSKLKTTLEAIERVLTQLLPEQKVYDMTVDIPQSSQSSEPAPAMADEARAPDVVLHGWKNRHDAYQTLSAIADYLSLVEPHSPTPYLLRRAVNWGRMPLPELMAEIIREEGDLNRLMNVLGLKE